MGKWITENEYNAAYATVRLQAAAELGKQHLELMALGLLDIPLEEAIKTYGAPIDGIAGVMSELLSQDESSMKPNWLRMAEEDPESAWVLATVVGFMVASRFHAKL